MSTDESSPVFSIDCRMIGPGGSSVSFYADEGGVEAIWSNENCPYVSGSGEMRDDGRGAALDGHNVSVVSWSEVRRLAALDPGLSDAEESEQRTAARQARAAVKRLADDPKKINVKAIANLLSRCADLLHP